MVVALSAATTKPAGGLMRDGRDQFVPPSMLRHSSVRCRSGVPAPTRRRAFFQASRASGSSGLGPTSGGGGIKRPTNPTVLSLKTIRLPSVLGVLPAYFGVQGSDHVNPPSVDE